MAWDGMGLMVGSGLGYSATQLGLLGLAPGLGWIQSMPAGQPRVYHHQLFMSRVDPRFDPSSYALNA
jgi:hypothetical protein